MYLNPKPNNILIFINYISLKIKKLFIFAIVVIYIGNKMHYVYMHKQKERVWVLLSKP